jgi:hypothetical protein
MIGCGLLRDPLCLSNLGLAGACQDLTMALAARPSPPLLPGISGGLPGPNRGLLRDPLHLSYLRLAGDCQDLTEDYCEIFSTSHTWD